MSNITVLNSLAQLDQATVDQTKVSIIDFHATWCGPCKAIAPVYQRLASQYGSKVQFFKCDVDQAPEVSRRFAVTAMPTFVLMKGSSKVDEMKGANPAGLMALLNKHAPSGTPATASGGMPKEKVLEGFSLINDQIDYSQVHCLNESDDHGLKDMLRGGGDRWLESDADEQLLLQIPLNQSARIRALRLTTLPSSVQFAPKTLRLYVNEPSVDFDSSMEPTQEIVLDEEQAKGLKAVELKFVRFQNVNHLSIFVVDNQGSEEISRIDKLELYGVGVEGMKMSEFNKEEQE
ncbi:hypothetical protein JCM8547_003048 [Rhodosporidiobolus lusitaniae]